MAQVVAYSPIDMVLPFTWYGYVYSANSSQIIVTNYVSVGVYRGTNFSYYNDVVVGGTLTGYTQYNYNSGAVGYQISGVSVSASLAYIYVQANNLSALAQLAFAGSDQITGSAFSDAVAGYAGNDYLDGGSGNDFIDGGLGNDTLIGGAGNDTLIGGDGIDTASYAGTTSSVTVNLALSSAQNTGGAGTDSITSVENLIGGSGNDLLTGSSENNEINGGSGNDILNGGAGNDTLIGGDGINTLIGGDGIDTAHYAGLTSNVTVSLAESPQVTWLTLSGSTYANDQWILNIAGFSPVTYTVQPRDEEGSNILNVANNWVTAINASALSSILVASVQIADGSISIQLQGTGANGGFECSALAIDASAADNSQNYPLAVDVLTAPLVGAAHAGSISETLDNIENILSGSGDDSLTGNSAANNISGGGGNDTLIGGLGNDTLIGGDGNDTLIGGLGNDNYVFNTPLGAGNIDTILGFSVADDTNHLENEGIFSALSVEGFLAADAFVIGAAATQADDRIIYNSSTGGLFYDPDGSGAAAAVQFATLGTGLVLTNLNFLII